MIDGDELRRPWVELDDLGRRLAEHRDPLWQGFGERLRLTAEALRTMAKVADGDLHPEVAQAAIVKALGGPAQSLRSVVNHAKQARDELNRTLRWAQDELEAMTPAQLEADNERFLGQLRQVLGKTGGDDPMAP